VIVERLAMEGQAGLRTTGDGYRQGRLPRRIISKDPLSFRIIFVKMA